MVRIALDDLASEETARVYFAARLAEAKLVEIELNKHGLDYAVEVEPYLASAVFRPSIYQGAAFYVRAERAESCRRLLQAAGLSAGLLDDELQ